MVVFVAFHELAGVVVVKTKRLTGPRQLRVVGHVAGMIFILGFRAKTILVHQVVK